MAGALFRVAVAVAIVAITPVSGAAQTAPSNELAVRSRQAAQAMKDGRFDAAAAIYRELVTSLPKEAGLHMNLGMALAMGGHEAAAIGPLQQAVHLQPSLLPAQLFLGSTFVALGKPMQAISPLQRVVSAQPKDPQSRGLFAQALLDAGFAGDAAGHFDTLTALTPRDPRAWYALARAYNAVVQSTLATFDGRTDEGDWRTLLLGDALRDDGRLSAAFSVYRRVLDRLSDTRAVHDGIVAVYEQAGHADWAALQRARAAAAVDCHGQPLDCTFAGGDYATIIAATSGRADEKPAARYWRIRAAAALTKLAFARLEALPDSRERREMRAELARGRGEHRESASELEAALKLAPDDPALRRELALAYHLARDYDKAIAIEQALLAQSPKDAGTLSLLGQSLLELQRIEEAIPALEKAAALAPEDLDTRTALGRAYVQKGDMRAAIPLLEPALAGDEDGAVHLQLARAYQATGQSDKAKPLLLQYQALQQARRDRDANTETAIVAPAAPTKP